MCGRFASAMSPDDLQAYFAAEEVVGDPVPPSWNVAPTDPAYAVLERSSGRQLRTVRWGLVPSWAKDASIGSRLINARVETVDSKPAFRKALVARRCLVPADGYYEWLDVPGRRKQPIFISAREGVPLAMAGLYEVWVAPGADREDAAERLWTVTVLTTTAEDDLGRIHDRMPLMVERERWDAWLDRERKEDLRSLLVPAAPGRLQAWPVSTDVGNVANDGAHLVEPVPAELPDTGVADDGPEQPGLF